MALDLTLSPLYRIQGQESATMPGLLVAMPPRRVERRRQADRLIAYLVLSGNRPLSAEEQNQLLSRATTTFYQTAGTITTALRAAASTIHQALLELNQVGRASGQYAQGWLALACLRGEQSTFLLSGPMHIFVLSRNQNRHIFEPIFSGKGLGLGQAFSSYFTQLQLQPGDRLLLSGKIPAAWESTLAEAVPATAEATRRRLLSLTSEDLNAVLLSVGEGNGDLILLPATSQAQATAVPPVPSPAPPPVSTESLPRPPQAESQPAADSALPATHFVQPGRYTSSPQPVQGTTQAGGAKQFPPSIPRAKSPAPAAENKPPQPTPEEKKRSALPAIKVTPPRLPPETSRQLAKGLLNGIQAWRRTNERLTQGLRAFLPRLLPNSESEETLSLSSSVMLVISLLVPLLVVTLASLVYFRYGRNLQYEAYLRQAQAIRTQAVSLSDPVMQRDTWQGVLLAVEKAESYRQSDETRLLRQEAESNLDKLLGIVRLRFTPAFSKELNIEISRMAASENDLYLLDARSGEVWHAQLSGRGLEMDTTFNCKPGLYGGYQVGPLVDILALPLLNAVNATVVGIDASGNLLYCAPRQTPQAIPLPPPDTNWGRVVAMTLDSGNLYVLDAPSRAVWVYVGKDSAFVDRPYFFFGGQIPNIQDSIDLAVNGDNLYLLHADGHLSTCSYSRIESVPTRCQDPAPLVNPFAAYKDTNLFAQAHLTQMVYTAPPDSSILLLDADNQRVLRFGPRSLELQQIIRSLNGKDNSLPAGPISALTTSPNHILYLAIKGQVYFATDLP
ncbi:MAG: hypothetical protein ACP5QU_01920 [Anaerolineae bacterium]